MKTIQIGIIGDFDPQNTLHAATEKSLQHAGDSLGLAIRSEWLATEAPHDYSKYDGLFCSPGSPYRNLDGALAAIRFARESAIPFLGTCGGFQHAVIEFARHVMGLRGATHAEYEPHASVLFVTPLTCTLVGKTMVVSVLEGSKARAGYGRDLVAEEYYCNFGLNQEYREALEAAGMLVSGWDEERQPRIVELPSHPFFLATLFVPQAKSSSQAPHPIISSFCRAAQERAQSRSKTAVEHA